MEEVCDCDGLRAEIDRLREREKALGPVVEAARRLGNHTARSFTAMTELGDALEALEGKP